MRTITIILAATLALLLAAPLIAQETVTLPRRAKALSGPVTTVYSVGKEEGASHEILSNVQAAVFDRQNNLYVLDAGNFRVLVFDPQGRFVRQIGKQGQGPGEITFPTGLALTADGHVAVSDAGRGGFSLFTREGEYVRHVTFGAETGMLGAGGIQASARGGVVARVMPGMVRRTGDGPPDVPRQAFIRHHPLTEGGRFTTLHTFDLPAPRITTSGSGGNVRTMISVTPPAFTPQVSFGVLPDGGIALTNSADYAVQIIDAGGRAVRVIGRDERPRRVTRADQDVAREQRRRALEGRGGGGGVAVANVGGQRSFSFGGGRAMSSEQIEQELRNMEFADVVPLVLGVSTDPTGRIWVERTPPRPGPGPGPIDLVSADGRYIGTISGMKRPAAVNGDGTLAAFIERDDFDVERVVVRSIPASWR